MKFTDYGPGKARRRRSGYTLLEVLVASSVGAVIMGIALIFLTFAQRSISGIAAQAMVSDTAAGAITRIQSRIRVATSISVDSTGNTLTLGFDDNYQTDSDGDGKTYNDQDHWETFQFSGTNGTSATATASNRLLYTSKVGTTAASVLVPFGVRNLPGYKIFTAGTPGTVVIRFGITDPTTRDRFQSVDIQATGVSLNRPASSSVIGFIP